MEMQDVVLNAGGRSEGTLYVSVVSHVFTFQVHAFHFASDTVARTVQKNPSQPSATDCTHTLYTDMC